MPSERRKIQNRLNQRRYRKQIKNRIQMLEKAIIDSGVGTNLDLGLNQPTTAESDAESISHQEVSTVAFDGDGGSDLTSQDLSPWSFDISPDSLDKSTIFGDQDFFGSWNLSGIDVSQQTSPLPYVYDSSQHMTGSSSSSSSHRPTLPWLESGGSQIQVPSPGLNENQFQAGPIEWEGGFGSLGEGCSASKPARGSPKEIKSMEDETEAKKPPKVPMGQRKERDPKGKLIASLREENKRLKELSTALVNMYDCTAKPISPGEGASQCHNLHATLKNFISRSVSNINSEPVPVEYNHCQEDGANERIPILRTDAELDLMQLSIHERRFRGLGDSDLIGCLDQGSSRQRLLTPRACEAHNTQSPTIEDSRTSTTSCEPRISQISDGSQVTTTSTYSPHITPLLYTSTQPSSHVYLESSFSCRLIRALWEQAFLILTSTNTKQADLERRFGFCLLHISKSALIGKFRFFLGIDCNPSAEEKQVWMNVPDLRDSTVAGAAEWDIWIEARQIEGYLESLGFCLRNNEDEGTSFLRTSMLSQHHGGSAGEAAMQSIRDKAPQVPYGSQWQPTPGIVNGLFDSEGNFKAPVSWLMLSETVATAASQPCLNAELKLAQRQGCYLDVNRFLGGLIDVAICLGRTAGFKREDVNRVLKRCLVKY